MVDVHEVSGTFRVVRVRFQDAGGQGAILVGDRLDGEGRATGSAVLRVPGGQSQRAYPFHRAQTVQFRGREAPWYDPTSGAVELQIVVAEWFEVRPRGANWVEYVAANPAFDGIGQRTAQLVWDKVGIAVFDLLTARDPASLSAAVPGLGDDRARVLVQAWASSGQDRLVAWLDRHALPRSLSHVLLRSYGDQDETVSRLNTDPYRLLAFGLSWKRADAIAREAFGLAEDDWRRLHAAIVHLLMGEYCKGHTAASAKTLSSGIMDLLDVDDAAAAAALRLLFADGGFVQADEDLFQLRGVYIMERGIADDLAHRCASAAQARLDLGCEKAIDVYERGNEAAIRLTDRQRSAVRNALELPFSVVVGGAGTGKTACLEALHYVVERLEGRKDAVLQMAIAGRAAKRMREATGRDAITIAGFLHTVKADRIAQISHLVIDESSMCDVPGFYAVLRRLRGLAHIVLVGDEFQLPPIGSGKVLHLLASREGVPVTVLDRIWRQAAGNSIITVATAIRSGVEPDVPAFVGLGDGVSILKPGRDVANEVRRLFEAMGGTDEGSDLTVITPRRRKGRDSALAINTAIHCAHFATGEHVLSNAGDTGFCVGDRFVCDVNQWDIDVMNGSIGRILRRATPGEVDAARRERWERGTTDEGLPAALVEVDGHNRLLDSRHLFHCSWGWALTCHRAQGSDFGRVIVVLADGMDRSWLYTAVTRGRRQVVLVGTPAQVQGIVSTAPRVDDRRVGLDALLTRYLRVLKEHAHG